MLNKDKECEILLQLLFSILIYLKMLFISVLAKVNFQSSASLNHFYMLI